MPDTYRHLSNVCGMKGRPTHRIDLDSTGRDAGGKPSAFISQMRNLNSTVVGNLAPKHTIPRVANSAVTGG